MQSFRNHLTENQQFHESVSQEVTKFVGRKVRDFLVWFALGTVPTGANLTKKGLRIRLEIGLSRIAILVAVFIALRVSFFTIKKFIDNIDDIVYNIRNATAPRKEKVANNILLDYGINPNARVEQPSFEDVSQAKEFERKI